MYRHQPKVLCDKTTMHGNLYDNLIPMPGTPNMAYDEWLLQRAIETEEISLRFYHWDQPTLSLGYFQEKTGGEIPKQFQQLPKVRRLSGGGAILHDQELTYSLAIPASHPLAATPVELYGIVHRALIAALSEQAVDAKMRGASCEQINNRFLCFLRGDCNDVLIGDHKILGSAQRRRKGAVLQHGSLILSQSPLTPEIPGIFELTNRTLDEKKLCDHLIQNLNELAKSWKKKNFPTFKSSEK